MACIRRKDHCETHSTVIQYYMLCTGVSELSMSVGKLLVLSVVLNKGTSTGDRNAPDFLHQKICSMSADKSTAANFHHCILRTITYIFLLTQQYEAYFFVG